jgi:4-amino-4-deoxy-L-arabinose transferase-like glycosyltransferase
MFRFTTRPAHYLLLTAAYLLMTIPNLGAHSLWDMDEGVNAEAGREMLESGNWITPYYNYEIRTAKPALLYWLQAISFALLGVTEFAARLPAVLCGLGSVWVTYELGRRMFSASTGFLAALILASCVEFCLISHAATPDPPLVLFLMLVFYCYWAGSEGERRWWFVPAGAFAGLAVLTKGPIGVLLPGLIILLHLAWTRRLDKLWDRRLLLGALAFIAVAAPWYAMVTLDTKGKWIQAFVMKENLDRFQNPADGHRGQFYYHVAGLVVLFVPWCAFLLATFINAYRGVRQVDETSATDTRDKFKFLVVWFLVYLILFSIAATKLPNYVLPMYPAMALLMARLLDRWRLRTIELPKWLTIVSIVAAFSIGVFVAIGLLFTSGAVSFPIEVRGFHPMPALGPFATLGAIPFVTAVVFTWFVRKKQRDAALTAYGIGAVIFLAVVAAFPTVAMNDYKVPKHFAEVDGLRQTDRDIRIAGCRWLRHSMVFYARRRIERIDDFKAVNDFLALPRPAYVLVPDDVWEQLSKSLKVPVQVLAKRYDFYSRHDILLIANEYAVRN